MTYISTRGQAPALDFEDTLLAGLARDGGLYVPREWPVLARSDIAALAGLSYAQAAETVLRPFLGGAFAGDALSAMLADSYASFAHPATVPLVQIGPNDFMLELFHGPTLAFKDVAMQLLARMMDDVLARRGRKVTIVGATSGDTGAAAVEAFRGREAVDIFILHPKDRVSQVQRRQMTTVDAANVHNIAIEGTFDDCQAIVKALFNDLEFRDRWALSGINSINWARVVAQAVYYFTAAASLGAPGRKVAFAVPTGNFGDVYAGYIAHRMGLPIEKLVVATNVNDILARTLASGRYEVQGVVATQSPSMDIQVASNFERLLFEQSGRDAGRVRAMMEELRSSGGFALDDAMLESVRALFTGRRTSEDETRATIARIHKNCGLIIDPHSAVGVHGAQTARAAGAIGASTAVISLATAHPAKFPDAVEQATGIRPALPQRMSGLLDRKERYSVLANDPHAVAGFIAANARAARASA